LATAISHSIDQIPEKARALLELLLLRNLLPFWEPRAIDVRDGGYCLNHDARGRYCGPAQKSLVAQARTLWFFSRIARSAYGREVHLRAARHGFDFLVRHMWDDAYGGFYWRTNSSGQVAVASGKHLYGQAFALFSLSEYAVASGRSEPGDLAEQLFLILDDHAWDHAYGGYREFLARDWSVPTDRCGYLGHSPAVKSMNTHLHMLEALTRYASISSNTVARKRLGELCAIISAKVVHNDAVLGAFGVERHARDWTPLREPQDRRASYGHDVETAWMLLDAYTSLGKSETVALELAKALFEHALRFGFDPVGGGFFESGYFGVPADRRAKLWWVQAEGMIGALRMYLATSDAKYARCFLHTLSWIATHQTDWEHGEWHAVIDVHAESSGNKAGPWKAPYHGLRAVLECLERMNTNVRLSNLGETFGRQTPG
jgi:cellobiose epimerase